MARGNRYIKTNELLNRTKNSVVDDNNLQGLPSNMMTPGINRTMKKGDRKIHIFDDIHKTASNHGWRGNKGRKKNKRITQDNRYGRLGEKSKLEEQVHTVVTRREHL